MRAKKIVNAAGPWVDTLRELDGSKKGKQLRLTKGVHLIIDQSRFPLKQAVYFDTPDKRMMFAIPRDGKTYVGTTDTFYEGDTAHPAVTSADRAYIIAAVNDMFPDARITERDVESSWAGVRPLIYEEGKDPSEISRKDEIWESPSGLITIAGGKLTGYRKMAETVVDLVSRELEREYGHKAKGCVTKHIPISGGDIGGSRFLGAFVEQKARSAQAFGLSEAEGCKLARFYGSNADRVFRAGGDDAVREAAEYELPLDLYLALRYAVEEEMAVKPVDFFIRRTGALLFHIGLVHQYKNQVMRCMGDLLKWDEPTRARYADELERELRGATAPADVSADAPYAGEA